MIVRIVRMTFQADKVGEFLEIFSQSRSKIASFEGCQELKLFRDVNLPNVYCTYSIWKDEHSLNKYRFSELFKDTWSRTKVLFEAKPLAFSLEEAG